ncbi:MAG: hypothetical protein KGL53_09080, partial [Elusimicrobia bacterium]|nr:hypothetical protein [Elusimicrobiota bacterium]
RTVDPLRPWVCALSSARYEDGQDCPAGSSGVTAADMTAPFKCALDSVRLAAPRGMCPPGEEPIPASDPDKDYDCEAVSKTFMTGPRCPSGTRPVPTPGALHPFKCVRGPAPAAVEPSPTAETSPAAEPRPRPRARKRCPKGTRRVVTDDPYEPVQCVPLEQRAPARFRYQSYRLPGAVEFQYPKGWNVADAWKGEDKAIYLRPSVEGDGRPVMLSVTRARRSDSDFVDLETRVWQEKDWHHAKELSRRSDGGRLTVRLETAGQSRLTLIEAADGYFALAYGAPGDLYKGYLPVFERLERSFRDLEGTVR